MTVEIQTNDRYTWFDHKKLDGEGNDIKKS